MERIVESVVDIPLGIDHGSVTDPGEGFTS